MNKVQAKMLASMTLDERKAWTASRRVPRDRYVGMLRRHERLRRAPVRAERRFIAKAVEMAVSL